jgi:bifunctional UDP-N-acetylglucosamine pyrophosphorylase / glucosamine-1-phosphate N-acetyltransferase
MARPVAVIILAAGKGTRMKSDLHKVLHPIAGRPMLAHLLASVDELAPARTVVVVGDKGEQVEALVAAHGGTVVTQQPQQGTADAVRQADAALAGFEGDILILYADVPFVTVATMRAMIDRLTGTDGAVVLASRPADARHYGRVFAEPDGTILKMVEHKDASDDERALDLCNSGLMAVRSADLWPLLARVGNANAGQEYYLPDIVMIAAQDGRKSAVIEVPAEEVEGINSRAELAQAEARWQMWRRRRAMDDGVTLVAPETVWFAWDTKLGRDVFVEPNVIFEPGVQVGDGARIEAHLIVPENSTIPPGTIVSGTNRFSFERSGTTRSAAWTGRFSTSERARMIVGFGPVVIDSLGDVIRALELRSHNAPPDLLDEEHADQILADLKELRLRLNELIHALERGKDDVALREEVAQLYRSRVAPWLKGRLSEAGRSMSNMLSLSPALLVAYLGLSQFFDNDAFAAFMSGAISGILGGGLQGSRASEKD